VAEHAHLLRVAIDHRERDRVHGSETATLPRRAREIDPDRRPLAHPTLDRDLPVMLLDDGLGPGQADPRPLHAACGASEGQVYQVGPRSSLPVPSCRFLTRRGGHPSGSPPSWLCAHLFRSSMSGFARPSYDPCLHARSRAPPGHRQRQQPCRSAGAGPLAQAYASGAARRLPTRSA
jgi:hypothetical protein